MAVNRKQAGLDVRIADLDLVNPYFRTREARTVLAELGVEVILPPDQYLQADLPILSPTIAGIIQKSNGLTLLDVGGDDVGATVLASLSDAFKGIDIKVLQVVNPLRPQTNTVSGCLKIRNQIEEAAQITITGLVCNANLIEETGISEIYSGYEFIKTLSSQSGLPLEFVTVTQEVLSEIDMAQFACPILPIARQLVPPWLKPKDFGDPLD